MQGIATAAVHVRRHSPLPRRREKVSQITFQGLEPLPQNKDWETECVFEMLMLNG